MTEWDVDDQTLIVAIDMQDRDLLDKLVELINDDELTQRVKEWKEYWDE